MPKILKNKNIQTQMYYNVKFIYMYQENTLKLEGVQDKTAIVFTKFYKRNIID